MGSRSTDKGPYKKKEGHRDTQRRRREDGDRDWSGLTAQAKSGPGRDKAGLSPRGVGGSSPADPSADLEPPQLGDSTSLLL